MTYRITLPLKYSIDPQTGVNVYPIEYPSAADMASYIAWCEKNISEGYWNYASAWTAHPAQFFFDHEQDLLAFRLRFGLHDTVV